MVALLLYLLIAPPADIAEWRYRSYSTPQGLSHETVLAVHRDQRGFLWAGTMGGLFRFDGREFDVFLNDPDDSLSLSDHFIHGFVEDADGIIWISTRNGGVNRYDWKTDTFERHLDGQHIQFLQSDADGVLWAGVYRVGLFRFSDETGTFESVNTPYMQFFSMASYEGGPTYFLTDAGLVTLDPSRIVVPATWRENSPVFMSADHKGVLHIYQPGQAFIRVSKPAAAFPTRVVHPPSRMLSDREGGFWFGTDNGEIALLRYPDGIVSQTTIPDQAGITTNILYRDRDDHIWLGTWGRGLKQVVHKSKFRHIAQADGDNFVLSMLEPAPGRVWVGTSRGVREAETRLRFRLSDGTILQNVVPYVMHRNSLGAWIGTQFHGLIFVPASELASPRETMNAVQYTHLPQMFIRAIRTEEKGRMWIGTENNGICVIEDTSSMRCEPIRDELSDDDTRFILIEKPGVAWVSTFRGGVNRVEWPSKKTRVFAQDIGNAAGLSLQDSTALWVANYGGGLTRINLQDSTTRTFTIRDGLPTNSLYGHLLDEDGNLWISTNKGLSRMDTKIVEFRNFTQADGLQSNEFNTGAFLILASGELLFGGINGYNRFHTDDIRDNPIPPTVFIKQIRLFDRPLRSETAHAALDTIRLGYQDHFVSFDLAALEFTDAEQNQFSYRMQGVDQDWIVAGTRNYVSYPNLMPGDYVFEVRAANSDGIWTDTPKRVTILIAPPFWQTAWFRILASLTLIIGFSWTIREVSTRKLKADLKLQHERERISRDLHDHVGAQLVNILSGLELAGKDAARSTDILASVREEAQTTIRQLRDTIWTLKSTAITPQAFLQQLDRYVRQLETITGLPIRVETEVTSALTLSPAQALNTFRIIQESLQNVIKHAGATTVDIRFTYHPTGLDVIISDNGRFVMPNDATHFGSGLDNMKKRAEEIGGKVDIQGTESGTTVYLHVPLS